MMARDSGSSSVHRILFPFAMMNRDDWREQLQKYASAYHIDDCPKNFHSWVADNSERLAEAAKRGTTPYFIANNAKYTDPKWENKKTSKAHNSEANKNDQAETIESAVNRVEEVANIIIKNGYHSSREAQMPPLNIGAVPSLIVEYATQNQISLGSSDLYITTKGIEHTIRESKVAKGINIAVSELIDFVKNRDNYTIYFDSAMGDFIFATSKAKFIVRPNYKMKIGKEKRVVFNYISATRISNRPGDAFRYFIKIKDAKQR